MDMINQKLIKIHDYIGQHEWKKLGDCFAICKTCGKIIYRDKEITEELADGWLKIDFKNKEVGRLVKAFIIARRNGS